MSYSNQPTFTKDNIDTYIKELAKEYRRLGGRNLPAELIMIMVLSICSRKRKAMKNTIDNVNAAALTATPHTRKAALYSAMIG